MKLLGAGRCVGCHGTVFFYEKDGKQYSSCGCTKGELVILPKQNPQVDVPHYKGKPV